MRFLSLVLFITLLVFASINVSVYGQANPNGKSIFTSKNIEFDSIVNRILISNKIDSIKISELNRVIANNRYAKYTFQATKEANEIAKKNGNLILIADTYRIRGSYYFYNSKLDSAEFFLLKSKQIIAHKNFPFINAAVNSALGGVYRKKGNIAKAIKTVLESKTILETVDTLSLTKESKRRLLSEQLILYNTLANFYNQMGEFPKAIKNYDFAYQNALLLDARKYAGVILSNKGDLLLNNGNFKDALNVLKQAKKLKIDGKAQESSIANTNQNIALALLKTKFYNLALNSINEALSYYKKVNATSGLMEAYAIRGRIYYIKGEYRKAIDDCTKSKQLSFESGILEIQEKACLCLSDAYEKINDYKKALENHKKYLIARDSIFNDKNIKKITQLEMQYAYDKENELRELNSITKEKENKATIKTLVISIVSLLLITGLLYRLFYVRQKANNILTEKNQKITETLAINETLFKETHHRVKNNLQIISSLLSMQSRFLEDSKSKEIVIDSQNRIKSMSLIHQKLYQENNITGIETKSYFSELITNLAYSYGIDSNKVKMDITIENLLLDVDTAIPLGLILNEMISNAFKHGLDKENGIFFLSFSKPNEKQLVLTIKDNGNGISKDFNWDKSKSYGMRLIKTLSNKLKADIKFENDGGLVISMSITKFKLS
jgi:two-component sensor histidine kinase